MSTIALKKEIQNIIKMSGYGKNQETFSSIVKIISMRHRGIDLNIVKQITFLELKN